MKFRVSIAQINPKSGDLVGNARLILDAIECAAERGAHLVVLPEMCLTGYCLDEKLLISRQFLRENKRILMERIVPACGSVAAVVGFVDFEETGSGPDHQPIRYNAAAVAHRGEVRQIVHKRLLPSYRYFDDKRYFTPGTEVEPVRLDWDSGSISLGVLICEDLWDDAYALKPTRLLAERGSNFFVCINASPFVSSSPVRQDGKRFIRDGLIREQIRRHGVPVVSVNTVGIGDNGKNIIPFDGLSTAHDRQGRLVGALGAFLPEQAVVEFENGTGLPVPPVPFDRDGEIFDALVMGVRDYYDKVGIFKGVLEAVSGGIDSALGTAIAYDAVGPDLLTVYNLPSQYNSATTREAARQLAENFGLEYRVVPIQAMVDQVVRDFEANLHPVRLPITVENLQARIRGLIMMAESNDREALLLTNGNETEIALGYSTLYGDMVGGLAVIGDLSKPDVYRLSEYVNRKWGREMIPREIFDVTPSAELRANQVDPFDYAVVGPLASDFIDRGLSPDEVVEAFIKRELPIERYGEALYSTYDPASFGSLARRMYRSLNASVYKRMQAAPIIVVSERAFGFDIRESIINGWNP